MLQRMLTVAWATFIETIRQPIYGVILLATAILMVLNVSLAAFTLGDDNKLLLDIGLSTLLLSGLFLSAFSAAGVLGREIENKTVLTVISKPISRPVFVLGKFIGLVAALLIAAYLSTLAFVLTVRHGVLQNSSDPWDMPVIILGFGSVVVAMVLAASGNFFYGKHFGATVLALVTPLLTLAVVGVGFFDESWERIPFGSNYVGGQIMIAAYLVVLTVVITAAVALAASTRFGQLTTLCLCTAVVAYGIIADSTLGPHAQASTVAAGAYRMLPNLGPFWIIDGLHAGTSKTAVPLAYVGYVTAYALLMTTGILAIAVAAFQKREVG